VYGPRQSSEGEAGVFAIFCEQFLAGRQPVIYGDGTKIRDYVFVADVVRANLAALNRGDGEIFNIASGVGTTDQEVFEIVRNLVGKHQVQPKYVGIRPGEIKRICLNIEKAKRLLDWIPRVSFVDGARHTVHFFQEAAQGNTVVAHSTASFHRSGKT
jgi:UDP-glucose 4-epimerase